MSALLVHRVRFHQRDRELVRHVQQENLLKGLEALVRIAHQGDLRLIQAHQCVLHVRLHFFPRLLE